MVGESATAGGGTADAAIHDASAQTFSLDAGIAHRGTVLLEAGEEQLLVVANAGRTVLKVAARGFGPTVKHGQAHEVVAVDSPSCCIIASKARVGIQLPAGVAIDKEQNLFHR